ncbi:uncharacterized protein LOC142652049 isoform X3 [Rhinoderma darwinii]|uniref:uncharacterized protein LOC142652049 isoform X3 n=1 Tax=Rhinoderma darwinii TaxID=43563 RepID=UPI003F66CB98
MRVLVTKRCEKKYLPARSRYQTHVTKFAEPGKKSRRWNFFRRHSSKVQQRPAGSFDNIIDVPKKEPKNVSRTRKRFWKCINRRKIKLQIAPTKTKKRSFIDFFRKKFGLEELQPTIPKKKHVGTQVTERDLDHIIMFSTSTSTNSYLLVSVATQTDEDDLRNISEKPLPPIGRQLIVIKEADSINKVTKK